MGFWLSHVKEKHDFPVIMFFYFQVKNMFQLSDEKGKVGFPATLGIQPSGANDKC